MQVNRVGVRLRLRAADGPGRFEVFDRRSGADVATGMRRYEAERDPRSRKGEPFGPTPIMLRLGPTEVSALRAAAEAFLAFQIAGEAHRILEDLYLMFASWQDEDAI
jgi:hypothetical protein